MDPKGKVAIVTRRLRHGPATAKLLAIAAPLVIADIDSEAAAAVRGSSRTRARRASSAPTSRGARTWRACWTLRRSSSGASTS
jgi:hypothetical protein